MTCPIWRSLLLSLVFCHQVVHLFHLVFRQSQDSNPRPRTMARIVSPQRSPLDQGASPSQICYWLKIDPEEKIFMPKFSCNVINQRFSTQNTPLPVFLRKKIYLRPATEDFHLYRPFSRLVSAKKAQLQLFWTKPTTRLKITTTRRLRNDVINFKVFILFFELKLRLFRLERVLKLSPIP